MSTDDTMERTSGDKLLGGRILILSDDARLARAIELNLQNSSQLAVAWWVTGSPPPSQNGGGRGEAPFDLLVLAASSPRTEPAVLLARAGMALWVGRVPLLIISDRPFPSDDETQISYLRFPFRPDELEEMIETLL